MYSLRNVENGRNPMHVGLRIMSFVLGIPFGLVQRGSQARLNYVPDNPQANDIFFSQVHNSGPGTNA